MNRKALFFFVSALLLSALLLLGAAAGTVYLADGGSGNGKTADAPLGNIADAYTALGDEGGRIVIVKQYTLGENFVEPAHSGTVTLTQSDGETVYNAGGARGLIANNHRYILNGPFCLDELTIRGKGADVSTNFILFVAQYHPISVTESVVCADFSAKSNVVSGQASIVGGVQSGADAYEDAKMDDRDTHITVAGGTWSIIAFSRQVSRRFTGMAHIELRGGTFKNVYLGAANQGYGGDIDLLITSGSFENLIYAHHTGAIDLSGNLTAKVTGGDFSKVSVFEGATNGKTSTLDLTGYADAATLLPKLAGFSKVLTESGEMKMLIADEVFASGSFTASNGVTLPYRYYLPQGYEDGADYPLFFYLHGNGSRGSDNKTQLTTNGAALMNAVLNSKYKCIILAPQCPASPNAWVATDKYPGGTGFAGDFAAGSGPSSRFLAAAVELLSAFIKSNRVDTSRIYMTGSSNGGGATWTLGAFYPSVFAALVPLAGTGSTGGDLSFAKQYLDLPIWTFHGDADTTLNYRGTSGIVDAVKAAGGTKIKYTVIPGGTHNIWQDAASTDGLIDWIFAQQNTHFVNTLPGGDDAKETAALALMRLVALAKPERRLRDVLTALQ